MPEIDFLRLGKLRPGATVYDIGAHHAVVACVLSRIVGDAGRVLALEANRFAAEIAAENLQLNAADNVTLLNMAVDSKPGFLRFTTDHVSRGQSGECAETVPASTIDGLTTRYGAPEVLFIDVEGYECKVLEGAEQTLRRYRPEIFIEVHVGVGLEEFGGSVQTLLGLIPSGYTLFAAHPNGEFEPFTPSNFNGRFFLIAR